MNTSPCRLAVLRGLLAKYAAADERWKATPDTIRPSQPPKVPEVLYGSDVVKSVMRQQSLWNLGKFRQLPANVLHYLRYDIAGE
eukprot:SAG22_NODE_1085_length_5632_cov_40.777697_8_plen_84_part_00